MTDVPLPCKSTMDIPSVSTFIGSGCAGFDSAGFITDASMSI